MAKNKFASWTKVLIPSCDGAAYQGNNKDVYDHKGVDLYFRGSPNMRANIELINQMYDLEAASKIVFLGSSTGGVAVILWIDYIKSLVSEPDKIYGIVDSGVFTNPDLLGVI